MAPIWEVLGSAVEVRLEIKKASQLVPQRLGRGALLEQVTLVGEELQFKKRAGTGPDEGWISVCSGCRCGSSRCAPFAVEARCVSGGEEVAQEPTPLALKLAPSVVATEKMLAPAVTAARQALPSYRPPDTTNGVHPARSRCEAELSREAVPWAPVGPDALQAGHARELPGMRYGLTFPHTPELLQSARYGARWLTEAFHATGTLPRDNAVTRLSNVTPVAGGGACLKASFDVEYAHPDPGLHTKLFMKYPFDFESKAQRSDRINSSIMLQPMDLAEIDAYRLLEARLPFPIPRFYFGDISNVSTNFILITEFIHFASKDKGATGLAAFEVEPAYDKFMDDEQLCDAYEYYELMTKANATMAGWYKAGKLGSPDLLSVFFHDQTQAIPESGLAAAEFRAKLKSGEDFLLNIPHFFPPGTITVASLKEWRRVLNIANTYRPDILKLASSSEDYLAVAHGNLNVDNTWWWRDGNRKLHVGVLDWGGLGKVSLPVKLWWSYYSCELHFLEERLEDLLAVFVQTYHQEGGPRLDASVLRRDVMFAALDQCVGLLGAIPAVYRVIPKKVWEAKEVADRNDPRLRNNFLTRMYVLGLVLITRMIFRFRIGELCDELLKMPGLIAKHLPDV